MKEVINVSYSYLLKPKYQRSDKIEVKEFLSKLKI